MTLKLYSKGGALVYEENVRWTEPPDVIRWCERLFAVPALDGVVARKVTSAPDARVYEEAVVLALPVEAS